MDRDKAARLLEMLRMRTEQRGATPAEAAQAADLAAKIIERYGLDATSGPTPEKSERAVETGQKRRADWISTLASAVARRFDLKAFSETCPSKHVRVRFIGPEHRVKVACWLFRAIEKDMRRMAGAECRRRSLGGGAMVRFRNQYFDSFSLTIWSRLDPRTKEEREAARELIRQQMANLAPPKPSSKIYVPKMTKEDWAAYDAGRADAESIELGTDVLPGSTRREPLLIGGRTA